MPDVCLISLLSGKWSYLAIPSDTIPFRSKWLRFFVRRTSGSGEILWPNLFDIELVNSFASALLRAKVVRL